ncbi:class I SAM-dependent methyltransferase [uncultured Cellulomonas sp.]|uniref:class I SAM-dependent DNA methyltransferase n=1 Tax=uncultured Cellulomonas sp. TaxID=189682 RepID=UPI0028EF15F8|nr:class I SAM-dependent methyltransferase [uncultured Cellulomonas sp.]
MTVVEGQGARPYVHLARVYDRWTASNDHGRWAEYLRAAAGRLGVTGGRAVDVCCGTGRMSALLDEAGFSVTGIDSSPEMLDEARRAVPAVVLHQGDVTDPLPVLDGSQDLAVCSFDSANYLVSEGALAAMFSVVARSLRPGGVFVVDLNTGYKLVEVFGSSHYGDDLGDFAYVWRNRTEPDRRRTEFLISLFVESTSGYSRFTEHHVQRWFTWDEVRSAVDAAGLRVVEVTDDYGRAAPSDTTLRETWVLQRPEIAVASLG